MDFLKMIMLFVPMYLFHCTQITQATTAGGATLAAGASAVFLLYM
jgi:hypothetical protein